MDTEETEESRSIRCAFTRADTPDVNPRGLTPFTDPIHSDQVRAPPGSLKPAILAATAPRIEFIPTADARVLTFQEPPAKRNFLAVKNPWHYRRDAYPR